jgi:hypothetical protein
MLDLGLYARFNKKDHGVRIDITIVVRRRGMSSDVAGLMRFTIAP